MTVFKARKRSSSQVFHDRTVNEAKRWAHLMACKMPGIVFTAIVEDEMFSYEKREGDVWPRKV